MSNSPFYKTGVSKSPLFHMGHGKDKITNHHGSYNDGDLIDESDSEKVQGGPGINVQDLNPIQSDKKGQFIVNKTGEESPYVDSKRQDTIRPLKGSGKFMKGYDIPTLMPKSKK